MATDVKAGPLDPPYMCYHCTKAAASATDCLEHQLVHHAHEDQKLSLRKLQLDEHTGQNIYRSLHFNITLKEIKKQKNTMHKIYIDEERCKVMYKRTVTDSTDQCHEDSNKDTLQETIFNAAKVLKSIGREEDFISVVEALSNGTLSPKNMALQLLLDVGMQIRQKQYQIRYSRTSLDFWLIVQKLFRGKCIRFFRGFSEAKEGSTEDSQGHNANVNFAVPSDTILQRESNAYKLDLRSPGILQHSVEAFSKVHAGKDCKLSIDGKKIAYGFGKNLGEEDLGGYEEPPTLAERQHELKEHNQTIDNAIEAIAELHSDDLVSLTPEQKQRVREKLTSVISVLSSRIRYLRKYSLKKKMSVRTLLRKIEGPWRESKLSNAISYFQTQAVKSDMIIDKLLSTVDKLGYCVSVVNGTSHLYCQGSSTVLDFEHQGNFICLRGIESKNTDVYANSEFVKQRSQAWKDLRNGAVVTGSSFYKAIGCGTLKEQREHFEKVVNHIEKPVSDYTQKCFQHGTDNEIHALATLVGKIMPVYFPDMKFREDGCICLPMDNGKYAVVSGDGSGISNGKPAVAFELKCPMTGKEFTTDVYYSLPPYYTTQVLSQMAAKKCSTFTNLCYTPQSSTVITGKHDSEVWHKVWSLANELYAASDYKKPTKRSEQSVDITGNLKELAAKSTFIGEFPSLRGQSCKCTSGITSPEEAFFEHVGRDIQEPEPNTAGICSVTLQRAKAELQDAYDQVRRPAKELLLTVISDLDRTASKQNPSAGHAMPIMYHMSGSSLKMESVRHIVNDGINAAKQAKLNVQVVAFDGQFLEVSVTDFDGHPTTLCKLDKHVWETAKKVSKEKQIAYFSTKNYNGSIHGMEDIDTKCISKLESGKIEVRQPFYEKVITPRNVAHLFEDRSREDQNKNCHDMDDDTDDGGHVDEDILLQYLPDEIVNMLDGESIDALKAAGSSLQQSTEKTNPPSYAPPVQTQRTNASDQTASNLSANDELLELVLIALITCAPTAAKQEKWGSTSVAQLRSMLTSAHVIAQQFTVQELQVILSCTPGRSISIKTCRKPELVNKVAQLHGDGSTISFAKVSSLRNIILTKLRKLPKSSTNVIYATNIWPKYKEEYEEKAFFKSSQPTVVQTENETFTINHWYAQPTVIEGEPIQFIIDPHHLLVNNRCKCCSAGIAGMGVFADAWKKVALAENGKNPMERTGLSLELVEELRDRQRNSFAMTTFSEPVEEAMIQNGDLKAAKWCRLLRNWYSAVDDAGIQVAQRLQWMMDMRRELLRYYTPGTFPPPGMYVAGLPMAQFEGLMCNIDRRIQLYSTTKENTYNHRAVSSLDSETMFGAFQDYDPKGTGVLRADDIPSALGTAVCLAKHKLDPDRCFPIRTSRKRVYCEHPLQQKTEEEAQHDSLPTVEKFTISAKSHHFDKVQRKKKPKRKSGFIGELSNIARGAQGVRSFHRCNEEKIMPHRRAGIEINLDNDNK